jgi:hypothetical protein
MWTSACCVVMIMSESKLVLGLDTSTVVNVGLAQDDRVLATATVADQMAHVEQLMPLVSECLDAAGVGVDDLGQLIGRSWPRPVHRPASGRRHGSGDESRTRPRASRSCAASMYWPRNSVEQALPTS